MEKKPGILPGCCVKIMNDIGACVANDPEVRGSRITDAIRISVNAGKAVKFFLKLFPVMPVSGFRVMRFFQTSAMKSNTRSYGMSFLL